MATPEERAQQLLTIIMDTDAARLEKIDDYIKGEHCKPFVPPGSERELFDLADKSVSNWMPLLIATPAQACYVDNFRPGRKNADPKSTEVPPEWKHWQRSRLDALQHPVHRGAIGYGHSFTVTEKNAAGKVVTRGLSALRTAALYVDPVNDQDPEWALTITRKINDLPGTDPGRASAQLDDQPVKKITPGTAILWNSKHRWNVTFESVSEVTLSGKKEHGNSVCPVTRFAASIDLEGRTVGVVEPVIELQDRINQTIFDLMTAQSYSSVSIRTVTGMAPPIKMKNIAPEGEEEDWVPDTDENGQPQALPLESPNRRIMFAESTEAKFGVLPGSPLDGFIASIDMSIKHLSAITQTPPHYLLGQIANLSADALQAAEVSLARKIEEFKSSFGESWERVFRLAGELEGEAGAAEDFEGEVIWRDMESRSLAQSADALGKMAEQLGIPKRGLWARVPNVTANELDHWENLRQNDDLDQQMLDSVYRATAKVQGLKAGATDDGGDTKQPARNNPAPTPGNE